MPKARLGCASKLISWLSAIARDFAKFGLVGLIGVVVDVGIFNLLRFDPIEADTVLNDPLGAKVVSVAVAVVVTWCGNRYWTFRMNRRRDILREFTEFAAVAAMGLAISLVCLFVSHYVLGFQSILADNIATNVIGLTLSTVFRFFAYRHWVFSISRSARYSDSLISPPSIPPKSL